MKKKTTEPVALIVACPCPEENVSKHGIIEIDSNGKVTSFLEKPKPTETSSRSKNCAFFPALRLLRLWVLGQAEALITKKCSLSGNGALCK